MSLIVWEVFINVLLTLAYTTGQHQIKILEEMISPLHRAPHHYHL